MNLFLFSRRGIRKRGFSLDKQENSKFFHWKKIKRILFFFSLFFFLGGGIASGTFFFYFFSVRDIEIERTIEDINIDYERIAQFFSYTKENSLFFISTDFLEKEFHLRFPEIETVEIEKSYPQTLKIRVKTAPLVAKWKYSLEDETTGEGFINALGMFFYHGNTEDILMIEEEMPRKFPPKQGEILLSDEKIKKIQEGKQELERILKRNIVRVKYFPLAQEIHFIDEEGIVFWLLLKESIELQIKKIETTLKEKNIFSIPLEYIDLRITGKLIYKPKL